MLETLLHGRWIFLKVHAPVKSPFYQWYIIVVLQGESSGSAAVSDIDMQRLEKLENENKALRSLITQLESRVAALEVGSGAPAAAKPAEAKV